MDVRPGLVEQGTVTELTVELPRLRLGPAPKRLEVEGKGIDVLSTELEGAAGPETLWSVRLRADGPPRQVTLIMRARYPDGESVQVDELLTVVPARVESGLPWRAVVPGLLIAIALAAVSLRIATRRGRV